jgi:malate dehydrogenase
MPKVAFVGAGNVGATAAVFLAEENLADIVLIDVVDGVAAGKALDLAAAGPLRGFSVKVEGTTDVEALAGSDAVLITAGLPRKPGMSRMDLLTKNAEITGTIAEVIRRAAPHAVVVNVTNPLDVITEHILVRSGLPRERVIGMAGVLDSARFRAFLAAQLGVACTDVQAMVLGGHGDEMVPLLSAATAGGVPVGQLAQGELLAGVVERTRKAGAEVVALLKTGSAYVSPAAAACEMLRAILTDERRLVPAAVHLDGEYGYRDLTLGVPVVLGSAGVVRIVELALAPDEHSGLDRSAAAVREGIAALGR